MCGHEEVVKLLLQRGAVCDTDKYEGARCIYGALTDSIRNLLISFDISKAVDTNLPFASHIRALLKDDKLPVVTEDVAFKLGDELVRLHRFMLTTRSEYFKKNFENKWRDKQVIEFNETDDEVIKLIIDYLYLTHDLNKLDTIDHDSLLTYSRKVKLNSYANSLTQYYRMTDRKLRAKLMNELQMNIFTDAREDFKELVLNNIIESKLIKEGPISKEEINSLQHLSGAFPDIIISINLEDSDEIIYYPVHRAILIRNEFFKVMFTSAFQEAQEYELIEDLNIIDFKNQIPVINLPFDTIEVTEIIIKFLYYDYSEIPIDFAIDILFAGNLLLNERLKTMAAVTITTTPTVFTNEELYSILRAGWETRMERLEHFVAKKFSENLNSFIVDPKFHEIIIESSERIKDRQETDTIELIDDIRFYIANKWKVDFDGLFEGELNDYYHLSPGYESYSEDILKIENLLTELKLDA